MKKSVRAITCDCGHSMSSEAVEEPSVSLGEMLFDQVRQHVDDHHPDLNLSNRDIWIMLAEKAYTPTDAE
jgi:hypothetical protein